MILIAYDGSIDAKAAIQRGGELFPGQAAAVVTVWQPFVEVIAHTPSGFGWAPGEVDYEAIDAGARQSAEERAAEGAKLARDAGLDAKSRISEEKTTIPDAILAEADAIDASAILMGSRGLKGLKSLLLGSVSHAVLQHADRTVIVVPSPDVAAGRRQQRPE